MSLGGGAGFGANYTPIRFPPLFSLTGPVMAPATLAAPEAVAPMAPALRLPQMSDMPDMPDNAYMTGEAQQGRPGAGFVNPLAGMNGSQIAQAGLNALSFFTNPLGFAAQYALTGKTPAENFQGLFSGGFQGLLGGGQQRAAEVPIGPQMLSEKTQGGVASIGGIGGAAYNDAVSIAIGYGATQEMADAAGRNAAGLVAQGMDPAAAVALAANYAAYADRSQMPGSAPTPGGQGAPGILGVSPSGNQLLSDIYGVMQFAPGGMQSGPGGASLSEEGSYDGYGGGVAGETGAPGESSYGLDR